MTSSTAPDGTREIPFGRPWIGDDERAAVDRVLRGHILTHGPECAAFEAEFADFLGDGAHCSTVSSCTTALHLAYLGLGVGPGRRGDRPGADARRDGPRGRVGRRDAGVRRLRRRDREPHGRAHRAAPQRAHARRVGRPLRRHPVRDARDRRARGRARPPRRRGLRARRRRALRRAARRPVRRRGVLLVLPGQAHHDRRGRDVRHHAARRSSRTSRGCARSASTSATTSARSRGCTTCRCSATTSA